MVPPVIHDTVLSSGHSGCIHNKARLKQIEMAMAASMNHPDARLAGYQTSGDERVFGVLKPYAPLGGTLPRIIGIDTNRISNGKPTPTKSWAMLTPHPVSHVRGHLPPGLPVRVSAERGAHAEAWATDDALAALGHDVERPWLPALDAPFGYDFGYCRAERARGHAT